MQQNEFECVVSMGPHQTLSFRPKPSLSPATSSATVHHVDLRDENSSETAIAGINDSPFFPSNYGPHISIYVRSLPAAFGAADALGLVYVNPRFQRRAYTLEQAAEQCMFRILDIVHPDTGTLILQLEHEVRSVVKRDGSMYKSCPFDDIPDGCEAWASPR